MAGTRWWLGVLALALLLIPALPTFMAPIHAAPSYEDFTTFAEYDPQNLLSQTTARASWASLERQDVPYLYKDYGVDHFSGVLNINFDCLFTDVEAGGTSNRPILTLFALANVYGDGVYIQGNDAGCIYVRPRQIADQDDKYHFFLKAAGTSAECTADRLAGVTYYLALKRAADNTVTLEIYSDSARTTLLETLNAGNGATSAYRYLTVTAGQGDTGDELDHSTGYIENLDLGEGPPENNPPTNDACESDAAFDVETYGWVRQTISDLDGVADLKTVDIQVTTADSKTFTLRWTQSTNVFSEISDPDGVCALDAAGSQRVYVDPDTDRIEFKFKVSAAALRGYCDIQATVIDDADAQDQDTYPNEFSINPYIELSIIDGSHAWANLGPGDIEILITNPVDGKVDLTVTANVDFDLRAKGSGDLSANGYTIPLGNVKIHADTLGSAQGLTTAYADIGGLTGQTRGVGLSKSFKLWITVPSPLESGDYTYSCYITGVEAV